MKLKNLILLFPIFVLSCASAPGTYKSEIYAKLPNSRVFEEEYSVVWKGILKALEVYKLEKVEEEDGIASTDWVYSTSNERFLEYRVNGLPRRKYLQSRYKYTVTAEKQMAGVKVIVNTEEESEYLKPDGSFDLWKAVETETNKSNELLRNIELKILSRPI
ncbi:MAG: hypothetical protein AB7F43_01055 [Bacteriovoracia bacterium]